MYICTLQNCNDLKEHVQRKMKRVLGVVDVPRSVLENKPGRSTVCVEGIVGKAGYKVLREKLNHRVKTICSKCEITVCKDHLLTVCPKYAAVNQEAKSMMNN